MMGMKLRVMLIALLAVVFSVLRYQLFTPLVVISLLLAVVYSNYTYAKKCNRKSFDIESIFEIESYTALRKSKEVSCPDWLKFPDNERVIWLNHLISILWNPDLKMALEQVFDNNLEKIVDESKPRYLYNFHYKSTELGLSPPVILGVKVYDSQKCKKCSKNAYHRQEHKEEPFCYLDFKLVLSGSDNKIFFGSKYKRKFAIQDIQINAWIRLKLCQFINTLPGFARIEFSLVTNPIISYSVSAFNLQLSAVPGVKRWLNKFFKEDIFDSCRFPEYIPYEFQIEQIDWLRATGKLKLYGESIQHRGILKIYIKTVTLYKPPTSEVNSYLVLKTPRELRRTDSFLSLNRKSEFTYNEQIVLYGVDQKTKVDIFVFNEDESDADAILGQCFVDVLEEHYKNTDGDVTFDLLDVGNKSKIGRINFEFNYIAPKKEKITSFADEKRIKIPNKKQNMTINKPVSTINHVTVSIIKADGIPSQKNSRSYNVVVIIVGDYCVKTSKVQCTESPIFNEEFEFELPFKYTKEIIILFYKLSSKVKSSLIGKANIKFLDNDGLFLLDEDRHVEWYPLEMDSEDDMFKSSNRQIKVGIMSKIFNLTRKKKTFSSKKLEKKLCNNREKRNKEQFIVEIKQARNLNLLKVGSSEVNSYVTLAVNGSDVQKTREMDKCNSPIWCESFRYTVRSSRNVEIVINVVDCSSKTHRILGSVKLEIDEVQLLNNSKVWYPLGRKGFVREARSFKVIDCEHTEEFRVSESLGSNNEKSVKVNNSQEKSVSGEEICRRKSFSQSVRHNSLTIKSKDSAVKKMEEVYDAENDSYSQSFEENMSPEILVHVYNQDESSIKRGSYIISRTISHENSRSSRKNRFGNMKKNISESSIGLFKKLKKAIKFKEKMQVVDRRKEGTGARIEALVKVEQNSVVWTKRSKLISSTMRFQIDKQTTIERNSGRLVVSRRSEQVEFLGDEKQIEELNQKLEMISIV